MQGAAQRIVDRVAGDVGRPALLEDQFERVLAYSTHDDPVDSVRNRTILHRQADPEVVDWLNMRGIRSARSPVRVPGNAELGMLPRLCFPIRHRGALLGYLWFAEPAARMSPQDMARAGHAATELGAVLYRDVAARDSAPEHAARAVRQLLQPGDRAAAARQLHEDGYLRPEDGVAAVVLRPVAPASPAGSGRQLARALTQIAQARQRILPLRQDDHGLLVVPLAAAEAGSLDARVGAITDVLRSAGEPAPYVGVGDWRASPAELADSYREARLAARTAHALSRTDASHWSRLGAYQIVAELADEPAPTRVIHPGLQALLGDPEAAPLLETLETYLDVACNAQLAAELLHLHRGSLYYRLQRVEQLAGASLRDGMERLALHLQLKLARFNGAYAPRREGAPAPAAAS